MNRYSGKSLKRKRRAVFLDKDGTLLRDIPYNVDPARMALMPGAVEGVQRMHADGYAIVIVSNQSGVAHGFFAKSALRNVEARLHEMLAEIGVPLRGFYYCPHHPNAMVAKYAIACRCRKPQAGMLLQAAREHGLALERSWMVGDILDDVEAGRRAGCHTILLDNGNETEWTLHAHRSPDFMTGDLAEAAEIIHTFDRVPVI